MTLTSVSVKDIDDKSAYGYPKRVVEFKTKNGNFQTPARAITNHEFAQKVTAATDVTYDPDITIMVKRLNYDHLSNFLKTDAPFENLSGQLRTQLERGQNSKINLSLLKLTSSKDNKKRTPHQLLQNKRIRDKFLRMIIQLQKGQGLDTITIPYIALPETESKKMIKDVSDYLEKENLNGVFFFDMNKKFPTLLKYSVDEIGLPLIGINYKRYTSAIQSYETIRDYYDKDVGFFMDDTIRDDSKNENMSSMHFMPFLGCDVFSSFVPTVGRGSEGTFKERVGKIKFFHKKPLTVDRLIDENIDVEQILDEINRPKDEKIRSMLSDLDDIPKDEIETRLSRIRSFSKVHEAKASKDEFPELRKHIKDRSTKDYVDDGKKKILKRTVSKIR